MNFPIGMRQYVGRGRITSTVIYFTTNSKREHLVHTLLFLFQVRLIQRKVAVATFNRNVRLEDDNLIEMNERNLLST